MKREYEECAGSLDVLYPVPRRDEEFCAACAQWVPVSRDGHGLAWKASHDRRKQDALTTLGRVLTGELRPCEDCGRRPTPAADGLCDVCREERQLEDEQDATAWAHGHATNERN